jgi:hypothetical protein
MRFLVSRNVFGELPAAHNQTSVGVMSMKESQRCVRFASRPQCRSVEVELLAFLLMQRAFSKIVDHR